MFLKLWDPAELSEVAMKWSEARNNFWNSAEPQKRDSSHTNTNSSSLSVRKTIYCYYYFHLHFVLMLPELIPYGPRISGNNNSITMTWL